MSGEGEGAKRKKVKLMVIISVVCGIYDMQHNFFYAESLVHPRY